MSNPTAIELLYPDRKYVECEDSNTLRETGPTNTLFANKMYYDMLSLAEDWELPEFVHRSYPLLDGTFLHDLQIDGRSKCIHWTSSIGKIEDDES